MHKIIVSSCLLGSPVRYDGRDKKSEHPVLQRWATEGRIVAMCPEMLGGLGTPRPPAEITIVDGERRVRTPQGNDVTREFELGAQTVADRAVDDRVRIAVLKSGSPSCGTSFVYDGTFSKTRVEGEGVTTALLRARGVIVFSEDELDAADDYVRRLDAQGNS